jgi:hypothetical protein
LLIIKKMHNKDNCKNTIKFWRDIKKIYFFSCFYFWFIFIETLRFTPGLNNEPTPLWYCSSTNCLEVLRRFLSKFGCFSKILWYQDSSLNTLTLLGFNITWYSCKDRFPNSTYNSLLISRLSSWSKLAQQFRI